MHASADSYTWLLTSVGWGAKLANNLHVTYSIWNPFDNEEEKQTQKVWKEEKWDSGRNYIRGIPIGRSNGEIDPLPLIFTPLDYPTIRYAGVWTFTEMVKVVGLRSNGTHDRNSFKRGGLFNIIGIILIITQVYSKQGGENKAKCGCCVEELRQHDCYVGEETISSHKENPNATCICVGASLYICMYYACGNKLMVHNELLPKKQTKR